MTVVLADPAGFVVDWNWQRHLTVWPLTGRHYEPRFDSKVLEHDLPDQPASQRQAHAAARRWWRAQGRTQVFAALSESASRPAH
jgi:hypothetical protein